MQRWSRARAADLAALAALALPVEDLSEDELLTACWDDLAEGSVEDRPLGLGAVLATDDEAGAVALVVRPGIDGFDPVAFVQLLVVHPAHRRRGLGRALLDAAEDVAWTSGAGELRLEGAPPFYLWPGVDERNDAMRALAGACGFEEAGTGINMALPSLFRSPPPNAIDVRRVIDEGDRDAVRALIEREWPAWWAEAERAIEHGCCHAAFAAADIDGGGVPGVDGGGRSADALAEVAVGFGCHSVSRGGWLGPMGTDPAHRSGGIGAALVGQVCRDLMVAEYPATEICWAGPVDFYARLGATVSRTFRRYRKARP